MRVNSWKLAGSMVGALLACTASTFGQCPSDNNCCFASPNGTPGCNDQTCCELVCSLDPFCCDTAWDGICAGEANSQCDIDCSECNVTCDTSCPPNSTQEDEPCGEDLNGGCNGVPEGSNCCFASGGLGCDDAECTKIVCALDPFCCETAWDSICAGEASSQCGDLCSSVSYPYGAIAVGVPLCGNFWADGNFRDTDWFKFSIEEDSELTLSVLHNIGGGVTIGFLDQNCPPFIYTLVNASGCPSEVTACLPAGEYVAFVATATFIGTPCGTECNAYVATIINNGPCVAPSCGGEDTGDCCVANGTPYCNDEDCCLTVCSLDPFCCQTAWDSICANEAFVNCAELCGFILCGEGNPNDCCVAGTGLPGCSDAECCETVCAIDPFCCETAWDGTCAFEASTNCGDLCPQICGEDNPQDCCVAGSLPGCNDVDCCGAVCAIDPFCCQVAWDGICAGEAFSLCESCQVCDPTCDTACPPDSTQENEPCGEDLNGGCNGVPEGSNCCFASGGLGCDDGECTKIVCSLDPFCCETAWDSICAGEAQSQCGDLCSSVVYPYGAMAVGVPLCGNFWADGNFRDTDWFKFSVEEDTNITLSVAHNYVGGVTIGFLDQNCPPFIYALVTVSGCPSEVSACLPAGEYVAFVAPGAFGGLPCGTECNAYVATLVDNGPCEAPQCGGADTGDCCTANGTPFCNDADCCELVCGVDPFCCQTAWDTICAGEAVAMCEACMQPPPANDECDGAFAIENDDASTEFSTAFATGSIDLPEECLSFGSVTIFNEVWFTWTSNVSGSVTVSTCNQATFDTRLAAYSGSCDDLNFIGCNDDGDGCAGFTSEMKINVECGVKYFIVVGAYGQGVTGTGTLSITTNGDPCPGECPWDLSGDGNVGPEDLALLLGGWDNPYGQVDLAELLGAWGPCPE